NTRFLWNYFLDLNQKEYEANGKFIFAYKLIMSLPKLKDKFEFLKESIAQSLQQVGWHFDRALNDYLDSKQKKEFPIHKHKNKERDSFTIPQRFKIGKKYVSIPKIGKVKWKKHRIIKGKVKHITIKQDGDQWYCSVNCILKVRQPK